MHLNSRGVGDDVRGEKTAGRYVSNPDVSRVTQTSGNPPHRGPMSPLTGTPDYLLDTSADRLGRRTRQCAQRSKRDRLS